MKYISLVALALLLSCNSAKDAAKKEVSETEQKEVSEKMTKEGYKVGEVIVNSEEGSECAFFIKEANTNTLLDPVNFDDEKFAEFKGDKNVVYFKYQPLRRMSRCNNSQPIQLLDVVLKK